MGKRGRREIANKVLREAGRAINKQGDRDSQISQMVYNQLRDWEGDDGPLRETWVLVSLAAGLAAPGALESMGLPVTVENIADVEALMVVKWMKIITSVTVDDIEAYKSTSEARSVVT